jgi:transcriptional regulator with XRE-family HTH domain
MERIYVKKFNMRYIKDSYELGINLKKSRENAELTQNRVSNAIGLNRSCLAYYEHGKTTPTIFTLLKLAKIYNVDLLDLLMIKK